MHKRKFYKNPEIKTAFNDTPFRNGDVLFLRKCKREPKSKKTESGWVKDYSNLEWWVKDYSVVTDEFN